MCTAAGGTGISTQKPGFDRDHVYPNPGLIAIGYTLHHGEMG